MRPIPLLTAALAAAALSTTLVSGARAIPHASAPVTEATKDSLLPTGTLFRIAMNSTVSSAHSKAGDAFAFTVVDDVKVGDRIAVPKGTQGSGKIEMAAPAHGGRVDGILHLRFDPIKLADGTLVPADITEESLTADANDHNGLGGSVTDVADVTVPGFFLIDFLRKGDDVVLTGGKPFHVAVMEDVYFPPPSTTPAAAASAGAQPSPSASP